MSQTPTKRQLAGTKSLLSGTGEIEPEPFLPSIYDVIETLQEGKVGILSITLYAFFYPVDLLRKEW